MLGLRTGETSLIKTVVMLAAVLVVLPRMAVAEASAEGAIKTAFLGIEFLNDNEGLDPTSDAERNRMKMVEEIFKNKLQEAGLYSFVDVPDGMQRRIVKGQAIGECGGCEISYGNELSVKRIAWMRVQKISNLILNMNVYIADVDSEKMTFVRSVDIRGNTDETWAHSIKWLIKRYIIAPTKKT